MDPVAVAIGLGVLGVFWGAAARGQFKETVFSLGFLVFWVAGLWAAFALIESTPFLNAVFTIGGLIGIALWFKERIPKRRVTSGRPKADR